MNWNQKVGNITSTILKNKGISKDSKPEISAGTLLKRSYETLGKDKNRIQFQQNRYVAPIEFHSFEDASNEGTLLNGYFNNILQDKYRVRDNGRYITVELCMYQTTVMENKTIYTPVITTALIYDRFEKSVDPASFCRGMFYNVGPKSFLQAFARLKDCENLGAKLIQEYDDSVSGAQKIIITAEQQELVNVLSEKHKESSKYLEELDAYMKSKRN